MQLLCNQNFNALPCRSTPFTTVNYGESYGSGVRRLARPVTTSAFSGTDSRDEVSFERGGTEVQIRKQSGTEQMTLAHLIHKRSVRRSVKKTLARRPLHRVGLTRSLPFRSRCFTKTGDPSVELFQVMAPVPHALRVNDACERRPFLQFLRRSFHRRHDFAPRQNELLTKKMPRRGPIRGNNLAVNALDLRARALFC